MPELRAVWGAAGLVRMWSVYLDVFGLSRILKETSGQHSTKSGQGVEEWSNAAKFKVLCYGAGPPVGGSRRRRRELAPGVAVLPLTNNGNGDKTHPLDFDGACTLAATRGRTGKAAAGG